MPIELSRRFLLATGAGAVLTGSPAAAFETLKIGAPHGTIDFAIGDSRIFRTTGGFRNWQGSLLVNDADVPKSSVDVTIRTGSIQMLDAQQTSMLRDTDFFDVERFPEMKFRSTAVERTGETTLLVLGDVTLRGITRPMTLKASVTERRPDAPAGKRYAILRAEGSIKRSEFGMVKFIDLVGDTVDITIRTDAWR